MPQSERMPPGTPCEWMARARSNYDPVTDADYRTAIRQARAVLDWAAQMIEGECP
jgi:hypothetical protein